MARTLPSNTTTTAGSLTGASACLWTGCRSMSTRSNTLQKNSERLPSSRRAIAITWNPVIDEQLDDCPCLQLVQCTLRDGRLAMKVIFRSNDMLTAAGANMYALVQLQKSIADRLGVPCGTYTHISLVPHIYYLRDMHDIEPFCGKGEFIQPVQEVCRACGRCDRSKSA